MSDGQKENVMVTMPDRVYQDANVTTKTIENLSSQVGKLSAENESLRKEMKENQKELVITVEDNSSRGFDSCLSWFAFGSSAKLKTPFPAKIGRISTKNIEEEKEILTKIYESKLASDLNDAVEKLDSEKKTNKRTVEKLQDVIDRLNETIDKQTKETDTKYKALREELRLFYEEKIGKLKIEAIKAERDYREEKNELKRELETSKNNNLELVSTIKFLEEEIIEKMRTFKDNALGKFKGLNFIKRYNKIIMDVQRNSTGFGFYF